MCAGNSQRTVPVISEYISSSKKVLVSARRTLQLVIDISRWPAFIVRVTPPTASH